MRESAVVFFFLVVLVIPFADAGEPAIAGESSGGIAGREFNVTGVDIANGSFPSQYAVTPTLLEVRAEVSDTSLPGPKGEMAAGPRSIGFTADPVSLLIVLVVVIAITAGFLSVIRRKPEDNGNNDAEDGDEKSKNPEKS